MSDAPDVGLPERCLPVGVVVELVGLRDPTLEGRRGRVVGHTDVDGEPRMQVETEDGVATAAAPLHVVPIGCTPLGCEVNIEGLQSEKFSRHNGRVGVVQRYKLAKNDGTVCMDVLVQATDEDPAPVVMLKPKNAVPRHPKGAAVEIHGLTTQPEMNGMTATVVGTKAIGDVNLMLVERGDVPGEVVPIHASNLRPLDGEGVEGGASASAPRAPTPASARGSDAGSRRGSTLGQEELPMPSLAKKQSTMGSLLERSMTVSNLNASRLASLPPSVAKRTEAGGGAVLGTWEKRLNIVYDTHAPTKKATMPILLSKFRGKEDALFDRLARRYKDDTATAYRRPTADAGATPAGLAAVNAARAAAGLGGLVFSEDKTVEATATALGCLVGDDENAVRADGAQQSVWRGELREGDTDDDLMARAVDTWAGEGSAERAKLLCATAEGVGIFAAVADAADNDEPDAPYPRAACVVLHYGHIHMAPPPDNAAPTHGEEVAAGAVDTGEPQQEDYEEADFVGGDDEVGVPPTDPPSSRASSAGGAADAGAVGTLRKQSSMGMSGGAGEEDAGGDAAPPAPPTDVPGSAGGSTSGLPAPAPGDSVPPAGANMTTSTEPSPVASDPLLSAINVPIQPEAPAHYPPLPQSLRPPGEEDAAGAEALQPTPSARTFVEEGEPDADADAPVARGMPLDVDADDAGADVMPRGSGVVGGAGAGGDEGPSSTPADGADVVDPAEGSAPASRRSSAASTHVSVPAAVPRGAGGAATPPHEDEPPAGMPAGTSVHKVGSVLIEEPANPASTAVAPPSTVELGRKRSSLRREGSGVGRVGSHVTLVDPAPQPSPASTAETVQRVASMGGGATPMQRVASTASSTGRVSERTRSELSVGVASGGGVHDDHMGDAFGMAVDSPASASGQDMAMPTHGDGTGTGRTSAPVQSEPASQPASRLGSHGARSVRSEPSYASTTASHDLQDGDADDLPVVPIVRVGSPVASTQALARQPSQQSTTAVRAVDADANANTVGAPETLSAGRMLSGLNIPIPHVASVGIESSRGMSNVASSGRATPPQYVEGAAVREESDVDAIPVETLRKDTSRGAVGVQALPPQLQHMPSQGSGFATHPSHASRVSSGAAAAVAAPLCPTGSYTSNTAAADAAAFRSAGSSSAGGDGYPGGYGDYDAVAMAAPPPHRQSPQPVAMGAGGHPARIVREMSFQDPEGEAVRFMAYADGSVRLRTSFKNFATPVTTAKMNKSSGAAGRAEYVLALPELKLAIPVPRTHVRALAEFLDDGAVQHNLGSYTEALARRGGNTGGSTPTSPRSPHAGDIPPPVAWEVEGEHVCVRRHPERPTSGVLLTITDILDETATAAGLEDFAARGGGGGSAAYEVHNLRLIRSKPAAAGNAPDGYGVYFPEAKRVLDIPMAADPEGVILALYRVVDGLPAGTVRHDLPAPVAVAVPAAAATAALACVVGGMATYDAQVDFCVREVMKQTGSPERRARMYLQAYGGNADVSKAVSAMYASSPLYVGRDAASPAGTRGEGGFDAAVRDDDSQEPLHPPQRGGRAKAPPAGKRDPLRALSPKTGGASGRAAPTAHRMFPKGFHLHFYRGDLPLRGIGYIGEVHRRIDRENRLPFHAVNVRMTMLGGDGRTVAALFPEPAPPGVTQPARLVNYLSRHECEQLCLDGVARKLFVTTFILTLKSFGLEVDLKTGRVRRPSEKTADAGWSRPAASDRFRVLDTKEGATLRKLVTRLVSTCYVFGYPSLAVGLVDFLVRAVVVVPNHLSHCRDVCAKWVGLLQSDSDREELLNMLSGGVQATPWRGSFSPSPPRTSARAAGYIGGANHASMRSHEPHFTQSPSGFERDTVAGSGGAALTGDTAGTATGHSGFPSVPSVPHPTHEARASWHSDPRGEVLTTPGRAPPTPPRGVSTPLYAPIAREVESVVSSGVRRVPSVPGAPPGTVVAETPAVRAASTASPPMAAVSFESLPRVESHVRPPLSGGSAAGRQGTPPQKQYRPPAAAVPRVSPLMGGGSPAHGGDAHGGGQQRGRGGMRRDAPSPQRGDSVPRQQQQQQQHTAVPAAPTLSPQEGLWRAATATPAPAGLPVSLQGSFPKLRLQVDPDCYRLIIEGPAAAIRVALTESEVTMWHVGDALPPPARGSSGMTDELTTPDDDGNVVLSGYERTITLPSNIKPSLAMKEPYNGAYTVCTFPRQHGAGAGAWAADVDALVESTDAGRGGGAGVGGEGHESDGRQALSPRRPRPALLFETCADRYRIVVKGTPESLMVRPEVSSVAITQRAHLLPPFQHPRTRVLCDELSAPCSAAHLKLLDAHSQQVVHGFASQGGRAPRVLPPATRFVPLTRPAVPSRMTVTPHGASHTLITLPILPANSPMQL